MTIVDGRLARPRPIWFALAAMVLGIAIGATFGPAQTEAVTTYTRAWSCQGADFMPLDDGQPFGTSQRGRTGFGTFQCDADLPHRAVVTRVRFTVRDLQPSADVRECRLERHSLDVSTAGPDVLASLPSTGDAATPGTVRLSTTSISYKTIDRLNHVYYLSCFIAAQTDQLRLWGADVTYTITAANG